VEPYSSFTADYQHLGRRYGRDGSIGIGTTKYAHPPRSPPLPALVFPPLLVDEAIMATTLHSHAVGHLDGRCAADVGTPFAAPPPLWMPCSGAVAAAAAAASSSGPCGHHSLARSPQSLRRRAAAMTVGMDPSSAAAASPLPPKRPRRAPRKAYLGETFQGYPVRSLVRTEADERRAVAVAADMAAQAAQAVASGQASPFACLGRHAAAATSTTPDAARQAAKQPRRVAAAPLLSAFAAYAHAPLAVPLASVMPCRSAGAGTGARAGQPLVGAELPLARAGLGIGADDARSRQATPAAKVVAPAPPTTARAPQCAAAPPPPPLPVPQQQVSTCAALSKPPAGPSSAAAAAAWSGFRADAFWSWPSAAAGSAASPLDAPDTPPHSRGRMTASNEMDVLMPPLFLGRADHGSSCSGASATSGTAMLHDGVRVHARRAVAAPRPMPVAPLPVQTIELCTSPPATQMCHQTDSKEMKQFAQCVGYGRCDAQMHAWLQHSLTGDPAACCTSVLSQLPQLLWERMQQQLM